MRRSPAGASACKLRRAAGRSRRTASSGSIAAHPLLEQFQMLRDCREGRRSGPGGRARSLRPSGHRLLSARSSPWDCAARSSASSAALGRAPCRAPPSEWRECRSNAVSSVAAISRCICCGIIAFDEERLVAIAEKQMLRSLRRCIRAEDGRVGDLVAVQMQDRQHCAVMRRVQKLVGMPRCRQRSGFGFAVADHACADQIGIVEGGAIGMHQGIAEFAALIDRTGRFRRRMAWNAAGK